MTQFSGILKKTGNQGNFVINSSTKSKLISIFRVPWGLSPKLSSFVYNLLMATYCFDLDNTLCNSEGENYLKSIPILSRITTVNSLYNSGNRIIICTARGSVSGLDWTDLTKKQLSEWQVRYHELWLNKPYADHYIDDKAIHDQDFDWK